MYEAMHEQASNGYRVIAEIQSVTYMATMWEDEGGAYHDSGWNQSWPDGLKPSINPPATLRVGLAVAASKVPVKLWSKT